MEKGAIKEWFKGNTGRIIISLFEIVIGILLFIDPIGFTNGIVIACGAVMLLLGLANAAKYFTTKAEVAATEKSLFSGLLLLTIGCFCVFKSEWFSNAISVITVIYGIILALLGLNSIQSAANMLRLKTPKWYLEFINALITIVFAIIIFVNPFAASNGIWIFTGIALIVGAVYNIVKTVLITRPKKQKTTPVKQADNTTQA